MPEVTEIPTYWFVVLEKAVEAGDYEQAAEAQRQLRRLGVDVVYRPRRPAGARKGVARAAS